MPKKIQLSQSKVKWQIDTVHSVLVIVGLHHIRMLADVQDTKLMQNLIQISQKAKALEIPIVDLYGDDLLQGMQQLGEYVAQYPQLVIVGQISPMLKQILPHLYSVTEKICVVDDAILLSDQEQHIQWIDNITMQGLHHTSCYNLTRLWSLTAPSNYVLSAKGVLWAIAEQLRMEPLEIDPTVMLKQYGLDSVASVSLIGLWRAHGASIRYEDLEDVCLHQLIEQLNVSTEVK